MVRSVGAQQRVIGKVRGNYYASFKVPVSLHACQLLLHAYNSLKSSAVLLWFPASGPLWGENHAERLRMRFSVNIHICIQEHDKVATPTVLAGAERWCWDQIEAAAMSSSAAASSYWRVAGMSYLKYSNLCADMVRSSLKEPQRTQAKLREAVYYRAAVWKDGKPEKQGALLLLGGPGWSDASATEGLVSLEALHAFK